MSSATAAPRAMPPGGAPEEARASANSLTGLVKQPAPSDAAARVGIILVLRTVVLIVVLGLSVWLLSIGPEAARAALWLQCGIIAATAASSVVFAVLLRRGHRQRVAAPMIATDLVVTSLLVAVTGGADSPYTFLYALSIVMAGALAHRRGALIVTAASIALFAVVALLAWQHAIDLPMPPRVRPWEQSASELTRGLAINIAAQIGVGALAMILGDQLQRGAETLATTRRAAADLLTLHQDIVRSLSSGLLTATPDGTILTANDAAADILRVPAADLVGRSLDVVMPGLAEMLAESGELRRADLTVGPVVLGVTVSPLRDVHDAAIGRVVSFTDLTELKHLEEEMRRNERLASVGHLAAGIAHEIRNPLASISGSIELLQQAPQQSDDDRTLMAIVQREIQRLNVLVGDLLDYANPRASEPVLFDLGVLVDEIDRITRADARFADVEFACEHDGELELVADPAKLRQVVWNLVRNAAEAAKDGGKHVRVAVRREDGGVQIAVSDDGPGIADDMRKRIFEPFFTTKPKGTGLGLATCHAVVEEHGGRIDVDTAVGRGTTMIVHLPVIE